MNLVSLKERIAVALRHDGLPAFSPEERNWLLDLVNNSPEAMVMERRSEAIAPRNYMGRIDNVWAALSVDEGGEGLCAAPLGNLGMVPLVATDRTKLDKVIRPTAASLTRFFNRVVRIVRFKDREDLEIIRP